MGIRIQYLHESRQVKLLVGSWQRVFSWRLVFGGWLLALVAMRFWPWLIQGRVLAFGDNFSLLVPGKVFTASWLRQGLVALWNPHIFGGMAWWGDISQSILYPSTLIFVLLSPAQALMVTLSLHLMLTGWGMYLLSGQVTQSKWLRLVAVSLWMFSTQLSGSQHNLATAQSLAWVPWVLWSAGLLNGGGRGAIWRVVALLGLQIWAGYPPHVVITTGAAVMWSIPGFSVIKQPQVWKKWLLQWLQIGGLTAGLTAWLWLPFVLTTLESTRVLQSAAQSAAGSLSLGMLPKIVMPYLFDHPAAGLRWGPTWNAHPNAMAYVGWVGVLVLVTRWRWWRWSSVETKLGLLTAGSWLVALGPSLPGYSLLLAVVPALQATRYPSMVLFLANLMMVLWLVFALSTWKIPRWWQVVIERLLVVGVVAGLTLWWLVIPHFEQVWTQLNAVSGGRLAASAFHTLARDQFIAQIVLAELVVLPALAWLSWRALNQRRWLILLLVVTLDIWYHTQGVMLFAPQTTYPRWSELQYHQAPPAGLQIPVNQRVLVRNGNVPYTDFDSYWEAVTVRPPLTDSFVDAAEWQSWQHGQALRLGLTSDWQVPLRISTIQGYTTLLPQDAAQRWQSAAGEQTGDQRINSLAMIQPDNPLLKDWAVSYYLVDTWFDIKEPLPPETELIAADDRWRWYRLPSLSRFRWADGQQAQITAYQERPQELRLTVQVPVKSVTGAPQLIIADRFEDGWKAWVNGQPREIINHQGMRLIKLDQTTGEQQVRLEYLPPGLLAGFGLAAVTILGTLLVQTMNEYLTPRAGKKIT